MCGMQSNAFDKSIKTAPVNKLLSNAAFQFSISLKSTWFVLYPFLKAEIKSDRKLSLTTLSDYAHYAVLLSRQLKWNIWLRSLCRFSSVTTLITLFYFTTIKWKSPTKLTTVFYFTTIKIKYLTTFSTLFYFTTTNPRDRTTLTTLLLSLIHQILFPQ